MSKPVLIICILSLCAPCVHAQDEYAKGKVAVEFNWDITEEEAVKYVSRFQLEIIKKVNFGVRHLSFNIEEKIDDFVRAVQRERIVDSVTEGERLTIDNREGTVVRIKFKRGAGREEMDELRLKYSGREEVIAWRYEREGIPYIILGVPAGKEELWAETIRKDKDEGLVEGVKLLSFDIPE